MFDPKIDEVYRNSEGEFVDIYLELRLPKGPESSDDEIKQAYRNFLRAYDSELCQDRKLAVAMTQFANRARAVLENERFPYNARWRQEGGSKAGLKRSRTGGPSRSWSTPTGLVGGLVGCITPLVGLGVVGVGLTALYNWKGSDWLDGLKNQPEPTSESIPNNPTVSPGTTLEDPPAPDASTPATLSEESTVTWIGHSGRVKGPYTVWIGRTNRISEVYSATINEEIRKSDAKASMTIGCMNGLPLPDIFYHAIPGEKPVKVSKWNVSGEMAGKTVTTNYGEVDHPWGVCATVNTPEVTQWTAYLK